MKQLTRHGLRVGAAVPGIGTVWILHGELAGVGGPQFVLATHGLSSADLTLAALLTTASYTVLAGYELLAFANAMSSVLETFRWPHRGRPRLSHAVHRSLQRAGDGPDTIATVLHGSNPACDITGGRHVILPTEAQNSRPDSRVCNMGRMVQAATTYPDLTFGRVESGSGNSAGNKPSGGKIQMSTSPAFRAAAAIAVLAVTLLGCKQPATSATPAASSTSPTSVAATRNARLLDAAGGYETLTETAFETPFTELGATLTTARQKASAVRALLSPDDASRLDALSAELDAAAQKQDRSAFAIAAVESYRILVGAQDSSAPVPVEVGLLDYAGFKYDALTKARPADWNQMAGVAAYARETWTRLAPRIAAKGLSGAFESTLSGMDTAVREKNEVAARVAVSDQLALVDALEEYFTTVR